MVRILFLVVSILVACSSPKHETRTEVTVNDMPPLMITLLSGEKTMTSSLPGKSLLVFYTVDCDHCQREAEAIQKKIDSFRSYTLYFIADAPAAESQKFADTYKLSGLSNVVFASATLEDVLRVVGPMETPTIFIYSEEKRLVKKISGETPVEEIVKFL
ncbi:MAG: redoxin domain-containing protein [Cyclobacteriaceae bacterium]|nr:redoxin domain-containing protein [Cyclobacteriaceae bacterium]